MNDNERLDLPPMETLFEIAKTDPDMLYEIRDMMVEEMLANITNPYNRMKIEALHNRIKKLQAESDTSLGACIKIYSMMQDKLIELQSVLKGEVVLKPYKGGNGNVIMMKRKEKDPE